MKPLKTKISITIDNEIVDKLKELSEQDDRSLSQYINLILKEYLKEKYETIDRSHFNKSIGGLTNDSTPSSKSKKII